MVLNDMLTQAMEYYTTFYPQKLAINTVDQEEGYPKAKCSISVALNSLVKHPNKETGKVL